MVYLVKEDAKEGEGEQRYKPGVNMDYSRL